MRNMHWDVRELPKADIMALKSQRVRFVTLTRAVSRKKENKKDRSAMRRAPILRD